MSEQGYYIVIPTKIMDELKVNTHSILMYGIIASLVSKEGYCWASNSYLAQKLHTPAQHIYRFIKQLEDAGYIKVERVKDAVIDGAPVGNRRRIWLTEALPHQMRKLPQSKGIPFPSNGDTLPQRSRSISNKERVIKNSNKELTTLIGAKAPKTRNADIDRAFGLWESAIGYPITSRVTNNRRAAYNLVRKFGLDGVRRLLEGVGAATGDRYGPRISDFVELQANLNKLLAWGKRQQTNQMKGVKIN